MKLKYSIEQLIHFTCPACNYSWTHSGEMPKQDYLCCPMCEESFELDLAEDITTRPLIVAFSDDELMVELEKRGWKSQSKDMHDLQLAILKKWADPLDDNWDFTNAISPDAGMPQRGVK